MFFGLAEMRIVGLIVLLETGVQLMTDLILVLLSRDAPIPHILDIVFIYMCPSA